MIKTLKKLRLALRPQLLPSDLASLLLSLNPQKSYEERMEFLGQLMEWVRLPVTTIPQDDTPQFVHSRNVRFKFLLNFLERNPQEAEYLAQTIREHIFSGSAVGLYSVTGLTENYGFFNELSNRLISRVLPDTHSERDLAEAFATLFTQEEDAIWLESSFKHHYSLIENFFVKHSISIAPLKNDLHDAKIILGAQLASLGTSSSIRRHMTGKKLVESSFFKLNTAINSSAEDETLLSIITHCREDLGHVRKKIESSGVSVDLIFKLEKCHSIIDRIEMLIYLGKEYGQNISLILGQFIGRLIRDELKNLSVKSYVGENLHLLTRKIVERSSERGEYYISTNKEERRLLFQSASWAGIITAFTAMFKYLISIKPFPLFFEGLFYFINYAISFLIMQKWHMALSSKQPAYTAYVLSNSFENFKKSKSFEETATLIRRITQSQWLTTIGNLVWVVPVCICLDWIWFLVSGNHLMTQNEAHFFIKKHDPFASLTLFYAFLTGVFLWISSIVSGWVENWVVFRDIPKIVESHIFFKGLLSKEQLTKFAHNSPELLGGIAGNLVIAFLLGFPIVIQKFSSLPLDIRHVTLSAGTIAFSFNALEWSLTLWPLMIKMLFSIIVIGFLNFSVSFYFATRMAAVARNIEPIFLKKILLYALKRK